MATTATTVVTAFPWFVTPAAPDLGAFVRRKHDFGDIYDFFLWNEYPPFQPASGRIVPHQVYFRVQYGEAAFHQQVRMWMAPDGVPGISLLGQTPFHVLGGAYPPMPSDWVACPVQTGSTYYWFAGEHKPPGETNWRRDAAVGHSFDLFANGTLSTVGWDDTGQDRDFNDIVLEVAVVFRRNFFLALEAIRPTRAEKLHFDRDVLPRIKASPKAPPAVAKKGYPPLSAGPDPTQ